MSLFSEANVSVVRQRYQLLVIENSNSRVITIQMIHATDNRHVVKDFTEAYYLEFEVY